MGAHHEEAGPSPRVGIDAAGRSGMLSGTVYNSKTPDNDGGYQYSGSYWNKTRDCTKAEEEMLEKAISEAIAKGFKIGVKVRRADPNSALKNDVGDIIRYAKGFQEGFHVGKPTPVVVNWTNNHSQWSMSYEITSLELVNAY